MENFSNFIGWEGLSTFGGASAVTVLFTQMLKGCLDKLPVHIPTRAVSYAVALLLLICTQIVLGANTFGQYVLCVINAGLVSVSSNGAYDLMRGRKSSTGVAAFNTSRGGAGDENNP